MKTIVSQILLLVVVFTAACEKKNDSFGCLIQLVNSSDHQINSFVIGDTVYFNFFLTNNLNSQVRYSRPYSELLEYLKVYKQNNKGVYEFIGNPSVNSPEIPIIEYLNAFETKLIGKVPINNDFNWPEMYSGKYYVGDSLKLNINDSIYMFCSRIYFLIE